MDETAIRARARALGFDAVGICAPGAVAEAGRRLHDFLAAGRHGDMAWMAARAAERADPRRLWPEVQAVIALGMSYAPAADPMDGLARRTEGLVSVYAQGSDYHDVLKGRLKALARELAAATGAAVKVFVDTAPVMEKPLAAAAGLGWQGKHTNLVSRTHGSWLFLGAIFTTLPLAPDTPHTDHCGSCRACLDVCPTQAFPAPYQLDARRCLAYLTIEARHQIPRAFRKPMGNRVFGCDDCLAVCPWNSFAAATREQRLAARPALARLTLAELAALDDAAFRRLFAGTPVKRTGRERFVRNVLVAIGNSGDPALARPAELLLEDPAPLVRGMAVWALSRLLPAPDFAALRDRRAAEEGDPEVREEWTLGAA